MRLDAADLAAGDLPSANWVSDLAPTDEPEAAEEADPDRDRAGAAAAGLPLRELLLLLIVTCRLTMPGNLHSPSEMSPYRSP